MRENFIEFQETSKIINNYLDLLSYSFCSRCGIINNTPVSTKNLMWNIHHMGNIHEYIQGIEKGKLMNWVDDINHGFLHGLCTSMVSGILQRGNYVDMNKSISNPPNSIYHSDRYNQEISFDQLNASCLLHDFLKSNGYHEREQEEHDRELEKIIPNLISQTYSHINPIDYNNPFLVADVIELRRYPDYLDWYKSGKIENQITEEEEKIFNCFYTHIRPSLEKCFIHREESWARHGPEIPQDFSIRKYPQSNYEPFAFEIDRIPFNYCFNHGIDFKTKYINPWGIVKGIIPLSDFEKMAKIVLDHPKKHDVLHAIFDTDFNDWVFVINHKDGPEYQTEWVLDLIDGLLKNGCKVIQQETLNKFIHLSDVITNRMLFLSK